jgi:uncharacterized glyoxalase superfamily protein PhnB
MSDQADAFEQLADLADVHDPISPGFARDLRRRVERALARSAPRRERFDEIDTSQRGADMSTTTSDNTSTNHDNSVMPRVITPYLAVHDANAAIEWYSTHFGATFSNIIPWEGRVGHAEGNISGAVFYLSDEAHELGVYAPERDGSRSSVSIVLQVAAVEQFVERAVAGGAVVQRPIVEAHGSRAAWLVDPFGHRWNVGTPVPEASDIAARVGPSEPYYMTFSSADVETAATFYGTVLRWKFSDPNDAGGRHVENTEMPIGLRPTVGPFGDTDPGEIQMWFTVRDFDDAVERVRLAGGTVVELNAWDSGREAICEDDQGVTFKLSEPAPGYDR